MAIYRLILRSLRRTTTTTTIPLPLITTQLSSLIHPRTLAFSSAEEAAAERRRRKRRLRIEPPLHALRRDPNTPRPPPDPRLPDTTSALTGPRLNIHNRVQSLIRAGDLDNAAVLARQSVFSRVRPTVFTCNAVIASMYRAKRYDEAVSLFQFFFKQSSIVPNIVSYNFLIVTHCERGKVDEGLEVYKQILADAPFSPSSVTYRHLTKGLIDAERIGEAVDLLREMLNKGLGADSLVYNNLIKGFLDLEDFDKANEFFDELKERCLVYDGVVNATFMEWFFNRGRGKEAMESYRALLDRQFKMTPATCNVLLEVLIRYGKKKEAWELFDSMLDNHTPPNFQAVNSDTFNIMVNECFKEGKFEEAIMTFRKVGTKMNSRQFAMDVAGYNNIIVRFAEYGMIQKSEEFFNELKSKSLSPDVTGYKTLIDAYLKEQRIDDALQMFDLMVDANLRVIPVYANKWFAELIQNNKELECSQILTKLGEKDPKPDPTTYEIVIKGLCGVGAFDTCMNLIGQAMNYGIGVTPTLREFLLDAFEKDGRKEEMIRVLDERKQGYWQKPRTQPSGPPRQAGPPGFRQPSETQVPAGPVGTSGPAEHSRFQGVSGGFSAAGQAGFAGPVRSWGPSNAAGNAGFQGSSGPSSFTGPTGASGYQQSTRAVGPTYSGPPRDAGFAGPVGQLAYTGQAESTQLPGPTGHLGHQQPNGPFSPRYSGLPRNAGFPGPVGHVAYSEQPPTGPLNQRELFPGPMAAGNAGFQGSSGPSTFTGPAKPSGYQQLNGPVNPVYSGPPNDAGFRRPVGHVAYTGHADSTQSQRSTRPPQQHDAYPGPSYPFNGRT